MIDLEKAKELVRDRLIISQAEDFDSPLQILEDQIEEHEWGWVIPWGPTAQTPLPGETSPRYQFPYIVDRVTGRVRHVSTAGTRIAVWKLLEEREGLR